MKELVETIAKALVDSPDEVVVTESETEREIVLQLHVAQEDMGKVIGKQGRIAKAIRSVVKAAASKCDKKVNSVTDINLFSGVSYSNTSATRLVNPALFIIWKEY